MISNDDSTKNPKSNSKQLDVEKPVLDSSETNIITASQTNDEHTTVIEEEEKNDENATNAIEKQTALVNLIPSAYSWRVIPTNYYPQAIQQQPANNYHTAPIIDIDVNANALVQQAQWHNDQIAAQYVATPQAPPPTAAIYSIDPNADLSYDHFSFQNIGYTYPTNYNNMTMAQPGWSAHPVIQTNTNNLAYPYDNANATTSPNNLNNKQQYHQINYDDYYSKDKLRAGGMGINSSGNLAYHYMPNDMYNNHLNNITNNNSNSQVAQRITDNNGYSSGNNLYLNTSYRRVNHYQSNDADNNNNKIMNNIRKSYVSNKNEPDLKTTQNKNHQKVSLNNSYTRNKPLSHKSFNKTYDENATSNNKKKYSDIVTGKNLINNTSNSEASSSHSKANETSSSDSPSINQDENSRIREANSDYNNYIVTNPNFYNASYNLPHYNQYQKTNTFKQQQQQYYSQQQFHDHNSAILENDMANLNLLPRFYTYNTGGYSYENKKQDNYKTANNNSIIDYDQYDPKDFYVNGERENIKNSRFFVIKSYSKDDVIRCIKHGIWCSTEEGNRKLDKAFSECSNDKYGSVYLFFSVNGSGQFCGMAQMMSRVDYDSKSEIWSQDKWQGTFEVKWIYIKDVPNVKLRHILLANNESKPVTNSRDTQEVYFDDAMFVLNVIRQHNKKSSILDVYHSEVIFNQFDSNNEPMRYNMERKQKFFNY